MKFFTLAASTLLAASTTVSARSSLTSANFQTPALAPLDDTTKVPGDNPLAHCQDPKDDILDLKSVDLSPNPPKAGQTLTVTAKGKLSADVTDGAYVQLQVKYGLITIIRQKADLCDTVKNVDLECPLSKDKDVELTKDVDLPKEIPPGKYTVVADVYTKEEKKVTCLTATVEFHRGGGVTVEGEGTKGGLTGKMSEYVKVGGAWKQGL